MTASGFGHLGLDERQSLFRLKEVRVPVAKIAPRLGRHRSTIYRELARNRYRDRELTIARSCIGASAVRLARRTASLCSSLRVFVKVLDVCSRSAVKNNTITKGNTE